MPIKVPIISTLQRTTYLGVGWDSTTIQAQLSADHITDVRGVREKPATHCQTVPETVGSDGSCI